MPALFEYLTAFNVLGDLQRVLSDLRTEELRSADGHDWDCQLFLRKLDMDLAALEARAVSFKYASEAARLLHAFDPVVERFWLDEGWVVAPTTSCENRLCSDMVL